MSLLPKVPDLSFINDIEASLHDENMVFVAADAHKLGDFTTYLFMSPDKGKTWKSIVGDLPVKTTVWSIKQDPKEPNLLFIGTEYGLYFSVNMGTNWIKLNAGVPTIPFRDVELHPRDNDLVGASFGRGMYVLDDYTPLRELKGLNNTKQNKLFGIRDAWWYVPSVPAQAKGMPTAGSSSYRTPNPPHGALLTYYIGDVPKTRAQQRKENEKAIADQGKDIAFPGWEILNEERLEEAPKMLILISDAQGNPIRWIPAAATPGVHRIKWDLRLPAPDAIDLSQPDFIPPWAEDPQGPLAVPGTYSAQLYMVNNGLVTPQGAAESFEVKALPDASNPIDYNHYSEFTLTTLNMARKMNGAGARLGQISNSINHIEVALQQASALQPDWFEQVSKLKKATAGLSAKLFGDSARGQKNEAQAPTAASRIWGVISGHWNTTQLPTATQQNAIALAGNELEAILTELSALENELHALEAGLIQGGAPYTPGRKGGAGSQE